MLKTIANQNRVGLLSTLLLVMPLTGLFSQSQLPGDSAHKKISSSINAIAIREGLKAPVSRFIKGGQKAEQLLQPGNLLQVPGLLNDAKEGFKSFPGSLLRNPVSIGKTFIATETALDSSYLINDQYYIRNNFSVFADWSIAGIPVTMDMQRQSWSDIEDKHLFIPSVRFDRRTYLDKLKKKLNDKINPAAITSLIKNPLEGLLATLRQNLFSEIEAISASYKNLLGNEVQKIRQLPDLFNTDLKGLKEKMLGPSVTGGLAEQQRKLIYLQQQLNDGISIDKSELVKIQDEVLKLKGLQQLFTKLQEHKARWESSGLLKKIREFEIFKQVQLSRLLNDPGSITALARQSLSLNGLQRLFLKVTHLDMGQNVVNASPLSFRHFISKGINAGIMNNNKSISFITGKQSDINSLTDFGFSGPVFSGAGKVNAIAVTSGENTKSRTTLSVSNFAQSLSGFPGQADFASFRRILVSTISNQLTVGEKGAINVELSRSATQYNGMNETGAGNNNFSKMMSTDNLLNNTAVSLRYTDELTGQGLSYHVNFNTTSNGYTNPGNSFLNAGTTEFGGGFRKTALKNKLVVLFRGNLRSYRFSDDKQAGFSNSNLLFDLRWKMKKGQYIAARYQPVRMTRKEEGLKAPVSAFERLAVDVSLFKKIGRLQYRNTTTAAFQKNNYAWEQSELKSISVMLTMFQHLLIGTNMIYTNLNYNYSDQNSGMVFLNSSLYAEAGYSYRLHKYISSSTGLIYTSIKGWYEQAGIRQTISGSLGQRFTLNLYIDIKKNLQLIQPMWNEPLRADLGLRYNIINKQRN